jgi:hypothetical protein
MTDANKPPRAAKNPKPDAPGASAEVSPSPEVAPKKAKAPALEDKPFADFVRQDLLPAIQSNLGVIPDLQLEFAQQPVAVVGVKGVPDCWQVVGKWQQGRRQFNLYFFGEDIQGRRGFSCISNGGQASSIESFLIDERKITLDLLLFGLIKRLNAQKWLAPN